MFFMMFLSAIHVKTDGVQRFTGTGSKGVSELSRTSKIEPFTKIVNVF